MKFLLSILRLFKTPVQWLGVDYLQFEIIIRTKLTMDFRSSPTGFQTSNSKKHSFRYQLFTYLIFGLLFGFAAFSVGDLVLSLTVFFTVIMVSLTMTLITEFTSVLFDQRDNYILLPRPINNRTLLLVRLVHIQFYIGLIAMALALPAGFIIAYKYNVISVLVYIIAVVLSTWMTLIFTTFIYLMISKAVNGERFKDIITYSQIAIAIVIFGSYQIIPRLMDTEILKNISLSVHWWAYFIPPVWLAALVNITLSPANASQYLPLSSLAVLVPVTGAIILVRSMSKGFGNVLGEASSESVKHEVKKILNLNLFKRGANLFCISGIEKAGWNFALSTTRRDRKFKQSVYPYFGIMLVFAVVILKPDLHNLEVSLQEKAEFSRYLFIVIFGFSANAAITQLPYTDTPEAAWIYKALPFKDFGHLLTGAIKAILFRFFVPAYALVIILSTLLWGTSVFPQVALSCLGNILIILAVIILQKMQLPFTQAREMQQKGTNSLMAFFSMILMFIIAGFVYATSFFHGWITLLICIFAGGSIVLMFRFIRKSRISA